MRQDKITHLSFIQTVIDRMNRNSFQLKGWAIAIISAFFALYASKCNVLFLVVAVVPTLMFWILDAYYLQQEQKFRAVYSDVVKGKETIPLFTMPIHLYREGSCRYFASLFSKTVTVFYGLLIGLLIMAGVLTHIFSPGGRGTGCTCARSDGSIKCQTEKSCVK